MGAGNTDIPLGVPKTLIYCRHTFLHDVSISKYSITTIYTCEYIHNAQFTYEHETDRQ